MPWACGVVRRVDLLLQGQVTEPLQRGGGRRTISSRSVSIGRQFDCRVGTAERFGNVEDVLELLVRHVRTELLPGVDGHAGIVVHLAQLLERIHRHAGAPGLHLGGLFLLRGHLLGVRFAASTAAPAAAASAAPLGNHARLPVPGTHLRSLGNWRRLSCGSIAAAATTSAAASTAAATCSRRRAGEALDRTAHQFDGADPRVDDVLERRFRALIRHAAEAVGDGADLHALDQGIGPGLRERAEDRSASDDRRRRQSGQCDLPEFTSRQHQRLLDCCNSHQILNRFFVPSCRRAFV